MFEGTDEEFAKGRQQYLREQKTKNPAKSVGAIDKEFSRILNARAARRNMREMERYCGAGRVHYVACDVLDRDRLRAAFDGILDAHGRIDLLVNAAGVNRSAAITAKGFDEFRAIRDLKLRGYLNLRSALQGREPRTWCNFGSLLGFTGQIGEVDYASGNDFLATASAYSQQAFGADEYTIGWTLWGSVGLGAKPLTKAYFEKSGMYSNMATEEGIHHFIRELNQASHPPATVHVGAPEKAAVNALIPNFFREAEAAPARADYYLDRVLESSDEAITFERVFDLERDSYLNEHLVNGYATLPGTFVTEIAAQAACRLVPGLRVIAFEDLGFHHFLRVYGAGKRSPKKIRARITERSDDRAVVRVEIASDVTAPNGSVLVRDKLHFDLDVILSRHAPPAPHWDRWDTPGEIPVPDPYHMAGAPALLTGVFASTTNTRLHPLGKRADYSIRVNPNAIFKTFRVPCILLDGLARTGVLSLVGEYMPLVAPRKIRRIDLYEETNDCELAASGERIELYATPREFSLENNGAGNRFVAVRLDGRILLQIKDVTGVLLGYVHRATGKFAAAGAIGKDGRATPASLEAAKLHTVHETKGGGLSPSGIGRLQ
jgi:NAD(P)-dependent dehydrogenase (short-subunit alcohol dehydrogenase family)